MNILMMGWGFPPKIQGGLDIHVYEISRLLAKSNNLILALPEHNCPESPPEGMEIIPIKCKPPGKSLLRSVSEYNRNALKACKGMDFDIVHSHDWFGVEAAESLRDGGGKPWVLTLHSLEHMRSCHSGKSAMKSLEARGAKECDKLITVSESMKKCISKDYRIGPQKIEVIYNSARIGKGNPGKVRRSLGVGSRPLALFLGRLSGQKGPEYFIRSAKAVLENIPEARFIVAGEGHLKESLESFSDHLGLKGKVLFPGFVEDKASFYSAADVFALPSLHEPFGITVLESLLSGTPAVVSENAGVLEKLPGLGCLQKVRPADSRDLAEKISNTLKKRERVNERERGLVQNAYSWERSARETERVYQDLKQSETDANRFLKSLP